MWNNKMWLVKEDFAILNWLYTIYHIQKGRSGAESQFQTWITHPSKLIPPALSYQFYNLLFSSFAIYHDCELFP